MGSHRAASIEPALSGNLKDPMAIRLYVLMLLAARAVAQTVEGSVFDAATGTGVGGVKVELLKGATPFYETTTDGGGRFRFDIGVGGVKEGLRFMKLPPMAGAVSASTTSERASTRPATSRLTIG